MARAPRWFEEAIASPSEEGSVEVDGCRVHTISWGSPDRPGLVLVHGGAAHARWWSFVAPLLTRQYRVVALDLSGHGDSGRREAYPRETWAREVLAVARAARFPGPPIVVGHSLGGFVTIAAAAMHGEELAGAIIVDSPVRRPDPESDEGARGRSFRNPKTYPDLETALEHFRLIPIQPCENGFIVEHVGRHSLVETAEGWGWKFDPRVFLNVTPHAIRDVLPEVRCRTAMIYGAKSEAVTPDVAEYMYELLDRTAPFVEIPEAHHHVFLDQPLAFVAALRALLADWEHSVPRRVAEPRRVAS